MKKLISVFILGTFFLISLSAGVTTAYKKGKGPLKVTKNTADILEFYFSGGTRGTYAEKQDFIWKPGLIAISVDGAHSSFFRHPITVTTVDDKSYGGMAIKQCKKKSGQECYLFANGYKIVWDNGSDKKKRKLKKKDIKSGKTLALLTELGFYGGDNQIKKTNKTNVNKKEVKETDNDIVKKLKELNDLLKNGVITEEEFIKAKKKLLN